MHTFHKIPVDLLHVGQRVDFPVYFEHDEKLTLFLRKRAIVSARQIKGLDVTGRRALYVRERDLKDVYRHAGRQLEMVLANPGIPSRVKASVFYVSSSDTMEKVFKDPRTETISEMKREVKSMVGHIMQNPVLMEDLFKITSHDYYTYTHCINVGIFATALAIRYYGRESVSLGDIEKLSYGFFLHDIGKAQISNAILNKPDRLSDDEWEQIKHHPQYGYNILMKAQHITDEAAYIALEHHEQYDGSGYPYGRLGNQIHPCARICAVADAFDALTTERSYKKALTTYDALRLMQQEMAFIFDYDILQVFIKLLGPHQDL